MTWMRILVVSDIHSNLVALQTVLEQAGQVDQVWCLGDVVGYGPAPNECVETLRRFTLKIVAGNHDRGVTGQLDLDDFTSDAHRAALWTRKVLTLYNFQWLEQLPDYETLTDMDVMLVHGSPRMPIWEYILSSAVAAENMYRFETSLCFFGHTHIPVLYAQEGNGPGAIAIRLPEKQAVLLNGKELVNPGSVGQPRDRDPRAAFAVFDSNGRTLTHHRVPYDIARTQAAMREARLPPRLIQRLDYGM